MVDTFHVGREVDNQSVEVFHVSAFAYDFQLNRTFGSRSAGFACQFQTRGNRVLDRINRYVGIYVAIPVYGLCVKLEVEWNTVQGIHFYDGFFDGDVFKVTAPIVDGVFIYDVQFVSELQRGIQFVNGVYFIIGTVVAEYHFRIVLESLGFYVGKFDFVRNVTYQVVQIVTQYDILGTCGKVVHCNA